LWEDLLASYAGMRRLGMQDEDAVVMDINGDDPHKLFKKFKALASGISKRPLVDFKEYVGNFSARHICFEQMQVGGEIGVFQYQHRRNNVGREELFKGFRDNILRYHGVDPAHTPTRHRITLTKKTSYTFKRSIANLAEVEAFLKKTYPDIEVMTVDLSNHTLTDQFKILMDTSILITPCGGVSAFVPFLPVGAHAIITDFYVSKSEYGFTVGESGSMEGGLWNHWAHIKKDYYQVKF
jgi:hypothetical protein